MTLNVDQHFVDRGPERERFARMLSGESDKRVLRVLVPAGHGKSWFVTRLFFDCEECGVPVVWLDFDARRSDRPVDTRYVVERFLEMLGEARLPETAARAAEWRRSAPSPETDAQHRAALGRALRQDLAPWTDAPGKGYDEFTRYEIGIAKLLTRLEKTHPRYQEVLVYQQRLIENIATSRLHIDIDTRRSERSQIVAQITRLTLDEWNVIFDDLCTTPAPETMPLPPIAILLDTFEQLSGTVREWLSGWLFGNLRRDLAHVRVVVAGRPEPACCAFFEQAELWGRLVEDIGEFTQMEDAEILDYYRRRDCTFGLLDPDTICHLARTSAGMMAQVGDTLPQGGGD